MLNGRILLVDDEDEFRACVRELFEIHGFHVDEASNGQVALEKVKSKKYDAIVTDMYMPQMSGKTFIHEARQIENGRTYILAMTGSLDDSIWDGIMDLIDARLMKPFGEEIIYNFLRPRLQSL